jgi:hypothetical protein
MSHPFALDQFHLLPMDWNIAELCKQNGLHACPSLSMDHAAGRHALHSGTPATVLPIWWTRLLPCGGRLGLPPQGPQALRLVPATTPQHSPGGFRTQVCRRHHRCHTARDHIAAPAVGRSY